jgi:signal transduction histidine kinase
VQTRTKITISLTAAGLILFGGYGLYLMRSERQDLLKAVEREVRLLGRSIQVSAENALRDRQPEDIRDILQTLERVDETTGVVVYDASGRVIAASGDLVLETIEPVVQKAMDEGAPNLRFEPPDGLDRVQLALPLIGDDESLLGGLVLVRPLDEVKRDLDATRRGIGLSVALFVLTSAVLGLLLGTVYISQPLARMAKAMRQVRGGDLTSALSIDRRDEVGALAQEFNVMVAELHEVRRRLEQETESRQRLQRSLQEVDKLVTIGQLSAGLAHEIGSPLQVLYGRARLLAARADDPAETRRIASILVAQTDRITRIVAKLLHLARRHPLRVAPVDVPAAVRTVLELLETEARRRGVTLTLQAAPELPALLGDADEIQQVVLNLVTNALNATPSGGEITIDVEARRSVCGNSLAPVPCIRMIVSDTGCGIAPETQAHLFDPFFTTRRAQGGTGLGLAVVKAIVTDRAGTIAVSSQPGHGTTFTINLPVNPAPVQANIA